MTTSKNSHGNLTQIDEFTKHVQEKLNIDDDNDTKEESNTTEDDWETLADKELENSSKEQSKIKSNTEVVLVSQPDSTILELYDFDIRIQMHQLVKEFTAIVDPTHTMPFRPKMINQSLLLTFNNPKHGTPILSQVNLATTILYNYSCSTPQDPIGKLRRSDGTPIVRTSSPVWLPPLSPSSSRPRQPPPTARPLTTDTVARRFIAGHLGIKPAVTSERRQYDKLVRTQAQQEKEERKKQLEREQEMKKKQEEERKSVWEE